MTGRKIKKEIFIRGKKLKLLKRTAVARANNHFETDSNELTYRLNRFCIDLISSAFLYSAIRLVQLFIFKTLYCYINIFFLFLYKRVVFLCVSHLIHERWRRRARFNSKIFFFIKFFELLMSLRLAGTDA